MAVVQPQIILDAIVVENDCGVVTGDKVEFPEKNDSIRS